MPDVHISCADNIEYLKRMPHESVSLVVTSPPYNIGKPYEKRRLTLDDYVRGQVAVLKECIRVLKHDGSICWQVGPHIQRGEVFPLDMVLYPHFIGQGLKLRNRIIWHYGHGLHCSKRLSGRHESIMWFTKSDSYHFDVDPIRVPQKYPGKKYFKGAKKGQISGNPLGKNPGDVWIFPNVKANHVEKTDHPCQFPVELVERLVLSMTRPGDIVLDPYLGSGTTVVAALKNGRVGYGCDIQEEYIEIAKQRIQQLQQGTLRTRPMDRPVLGTEASPDGLPVAAE